MNSQSEGQEASLFRSILSTRSAVSDHLTTLLPLSHITQAEEYAGPRLSCEVEYEGALPRHGVLPNCKLTSGGILHASAACRGLGDLTLTPGMRHGPFNRRKSFNKSHA